MKNKNLEKFLAKLLIVLIIFTSLPVKSVKKVLAVEIITEVQEDGMQQKDNQEASQEEETSQADTNYNKTLEQMKQDVNAWLTAANKEVIEYQYKEDGVEQITYAVTMPKSGSKESYDDNIVYDATRSAYVYYVRDENNNIISSIPFKIDVVMAEKSQDMLPALTPNNYEEYLASGQSSSILETKDGELMKVISLDSKDTKQMAFVVELEDGSIVSSEIGYYSFRQKSIGESFLDTVTGWLSWLWDTALNAISGIFNKLLLSIADGIQSSIDSLFNEGENLTVYKVIFGKIDKLSIDYWEAGKETTEEVSGDEKLNIDADEENPEGIVDNAPAPTLKKIVDYWYSVLFGIAISIYLIMLLYIGVRILLNSTGKASQKYKEMLSSWVVGIIILAFFPYAMRYTLIINNMFVDILGSEGSAEEQVIETDTEEQAEKNEIESTKDVMLKVREEAEAKNNIALTVVYIILLGQLIVLLGVYYKRVFMMAFLITIFPVVATLYIWEKASKGSSNSLTTWFKEYVVIVFTQTFHAIVYVVLINGAFEAFKNNDNWFVFMLSVMFLFEAEKIIRKIFNMQSSAGTIGDLAGAGAAAWGATQAFKSVFKQDKKSQGKDETDKRLAEEAIANKENVVDLDRALSQTYAATSRYSSEPGQKGEVGVARTGSFVTDNSAEVDPMSGLSGAKAVVTQEALNQKTKRGLISKAVGATTKAAGITLGLTNGLASGSVKEGFKNAYIGSQIGGMVAGGINSITGWAKGRYSGRVFRRKVGEGDLDKRFKAVGMNFEDKFDEDQAVSDAKARIIKEALAAQAEATRRHGKEAGELAFIREVERGRRRERM